VGAVTKAKRLFDEALREWAAGEHYEAHELLEDVAECFEEDDPSFDIAIAFVHVAAAFHKIVNDVGARAAPGKIERALTVLETAPDVWLGIDVRAFVEALRALLATAASGAKPEVFPTPRAPGSS
jgi:predicted metal-dependent hydrolase